MKINSEDYDKIINILNRNPLASHKQIASQIKNCNESDICQLFKEIRQEYCSEEVVEKFLDNNSSNKDPVLFINGVLKSICRDDLDQSFMMGQVFENIASIYEEIERTNDKDETKFSLIYKYFSALMLNKNLPTLRSIESALVLSIMFEVINFSEEFLFRKTDVAQKFIGKIQTKIGQFLLKVILPDDEWNEKNQEELLKAFNVPHITDEELENDPDLGSKMQKIVAMRSLNPFDLASEDISQFEKMFDELNDDEVNNGRDIKLYQDRLGVDLDQAPVLANVNQGTKIIVHQKRVEKRRRQYGGQLQKTDEEIDIEDQIYQKFSRHDIIYVDEYKNSLDIDEPPLKKSQ